MSQAAPQPPSPEAPAFGLAAVDAQAARLPFGMWGQFGRQARRYAVGLLLLDASARVDAFSRRHPQLVGRLVQKDLASHLNLSAETLCRLSRRTEVRLACA